MKKQVMKKSILILLLLYALLPAHSQIPIKFGVNFGGAYPVGTFADLYKGGISLEAVGYYSLPVKGLDLSLTVGYNEFKYKYEYFTKEVYSKLGVWVTNYNPEWTAFSVPVTIGARYKFELKGVNPYIITGVGVHLISFNERFSAKKIIGNSSDPTTLTFDGVTEAKNETGFGFNFGIGAEVPVGDNLSLDLLVKYDFGAVVYSNAYSVFRNNTSQFTADELKNIGLICGRIGIVYNF